jgi:uncharacterized 2Fe-2S/4Fe-4S cluster protein (DUF4445 family)
MICRICKKCGLCPGEGGDSQKMSVLFSAEDCAIGFSSDASSWDVGISVDLGTTSVAAAIFTLKDGKKISSGGEENRQRKFGSDIVSRISFSLADDGAKKLHEIALKQIEEISGRLLHDAQNFFLTARRGQPHLSRIVIAGNSVMETFAAGFSAKSLSVFPFELPDPFGFSVSWGELSGAGESIIPRECEIFFAPAVKSFAGGDVFCSMVSCAFFDGGKKSKFLADIGTNCELCVYDSAEKKIFCASTSAGPAFEGYGIQQGCPACEGAISKVTVENSQGGKKIRAFVLGGGIPCGICGTGVLSAVSALVESGAVDSSGEILQDFAENGRIPLTEKIFLSQGDIRNFQLAKSAVATGLEILSAKSGCTEGEFFLAGGFGALLDERDAFRVGMIPSFLRGETFSVGNASLSGAARLLLDDEFRGNSLKFASSVEYLDLAQDENFQTAFIKNLELKEI